MSKIQELIAAEMPNWQVPGEGTFEWDIDDVEQFAAIVTAKAIRECLYILADKGNYEGGAVNAFDTIRDQFGIDSKITYNDDYYRNAVI